MSNDTNKPRAPSVLSVMQQALETLDHDPVSLAEVAAWIPRKVAAIAALRGALQQAAALDVLPSEAVVGFAAFLTCGTGSLTIGAGHDAAPMAELVQAYSRSQGWVGPREDFASRLRRGVEAALPTQPAEAAQAEAWRELFFRVAAALQCLPSTFPDERGNAHVLRAAQEAQATREAMRQPAAALDRDTLARLAREAGAHAYTNRFAASEPAFAFSIERLEAFVVLVLAAAAAAQPAQQPLTLEHIEQHIGADEGDREAVLAIVREVEQAHGIGADEGAANT